MSLINDALRDLDDRKTSNENPFLKEAAPSSELPGNVSKKSKLFGLLGVAAIASLSTVLTVHLLERSPVGESEILTKVNDENNYVSGANVATLNAAANTVEVAKNNTLNPNASLISQSKKEIVAAKVPVQTTSVSNEPATIKEARLEKLFKKLDLAIARNRLSVPYQANALYFLDQIKNIDAEHSELESRFNAVQNLYVGQLEQAIENENYTLAKKLLSRAEKFDIQVSQLVSFEERVDTLSHQMASADSIPAVQNESASFSVKGEASSQEKLVDANAPVIEKSAGKNEDEKQSYIKPSTASVESDLLKKANRWIAEGQALKAETELENYLASNPQSTRALLVLFDSYVNRGALGKARGIQQGLSQLHEAHPYFSAQLLKREGSVTSAIELLRQNAPSFELDTSHNSLLAALYQKTKQHKQAHALYQSLLKKHPDKSVYLLGYALSADALGQYQRSLPAYRKIVAQGQVNPSVMAFVKKRLATLDSEQLAGAQAW